MEVHQFHANAIGVVEVELALAVFADFGLVVVASGEAVAILQHLVGVEHGVFADGEMVKHAELLLGDGGWNAGAARFRAWAAGEHVFEPVVAVRGLLAHPVDPAFRHAAKPVGTETEEIAVEGVLDGAAVDQETGVDDVVADDRGSCERLELRGWLHELHFVAFGILYGEPAAAVGALFDLARHLP